MILKGCGTALVTPFRIDGSIDEAALAALVETQIAAGVTLLIACGTTGEAATLSSEETERVITITVDAAKRRVPVFAGCTHNSTQQAVANAQWLSKIAGLTGLLTANPYYNRPSQEGQYQHFRAIAEAVDLPVLLYNIPGRTAANLLPESVMRLTELPNVVGIKESSGNLIQITELLNLLHATGNDRFAVFAGDDAFVLPILALGGRGLISVASNAIPGPMSRIVTAALEGDWAAARALNARYFALMQAHFVEPSPAPIKAVLAMLGQCMETLRLPMVPVSDATRLKLQHHLQSLDLLP